MLSTKIVEADLTDCVYSTLISVMLYFSENSYLDLYVHTHRGTHTHTHTCTHALEKLLDHLKHRLCMNTTYLIVMVHSYHKQTSISLLVYYSVYYSCIISLHLINFFFQLYIASCDMSIATCQLHSHHFQAGYSGSGVCIWSKVV